jgi:hypothetical protein
MARAARSGIFVTAEMVPRILAMVARGDRRHDIAAWFGVNQGRIKEVEDGEHGSPPLAPADDLPPSGSPGPKAEALREAVGIVRRVLQESGADGVEEALGRLNKAITEFDKNE